ncbi:MAG: hypothetical protein FD152_22 [Xanthobacteraceae bacterium]|nr:MAG: hypothetical protein FD152_22 [Xanthobacteraceae bacterium]
MDRTRTMAQTGRGVLVAPIAQALFQLAEWGRRQQIRKARGLTSEVLLRDIGLTPDDLAEALAQPLTGDASDALVKAAVARAGHW